MNARKHAELTVVGLDSFRASGEYFIVTTIRPNNTRQLFIDRVSEHCASCEALTIEVAGSIKRATHDARQLYRLRGAHMHVTIQFLGQGKASHS